MRFLKKISRQAISLALVLVMIATICVSNTTVVNAADAVVKSLDSVNVNLDISGFEEGKALPSWGSSNVDIVGFGPEQEEVELFVQDLVLYVKGTQAHVDKGYINQSDLDEANNGWVEAGMYSEEYRIGAGDEYQAYYWFGIEDGYSLDENAADKVNVLPSTVQLEKVETGKTDYGAWVTYYADMYFTFSVAGEVEEPETPDTPEEKPSYDWYDPIIKEHGIYATQTITRTEVSEDTEGAECWVEEDGTEKYYLCEYNYKLTNGKELVKKEFYKDANTGHFYFEILVDANGELYGLVASEGGEDVTVQKVIVLEQEWFDQYWLQEYGAFPDEIYPDDWKDECNASINNFEEVISNVPLTDAEKKAVDNGQSVVVSLTFDDMGATADTDAKKEILDKKGEYTVGTFLDINLIKIIGENKTYVTETNGKVEISFELPASLKNTDRNVSRTYGIMRNHDGEVEVLDATYAESTGLISFETDKFSTYAVVYSDTASEDGNKPEDGNTPEDSNKPEDGNKPEDTDTKEDATDTEEKTDAPKTGDASNVMLWSMLCLAALATVVFRKRLVR